MEKYDSNLILNNIIDILGNVNAISYEKDTIKFLTDFSNLPRENQITLMKNFLDNLEYYKHLQSERINQEICNKEGHIFSSWYESVSFKNYSGSTFKNKLWCKKCLRCGNIEFTFVKPLELLSTSDDIEYIDNNQFKKKIKSM